MNTSGQVGFHVFEIDGWARVHAIVCALNRLQHQDTPLTFERRPLEVKNDRGISNRQGAKERKQNNSVVPACGTCALTSFEKSNSGWGFPSVSHFMVTVSPSLTGSVLARENIVFSEGSRRTSTEQEQVRIPQSDTFTLLNYMSINQQWTKTFRRGGRLPIPAPLVSPHLKPNIILSNFSNVFAIYSLTYRVNHMIDY